MVDCIGLEPYSGVVYGVQSLVSESFYECRAQPCADMVTGIMTGRFAVPIEFDLKVAELTAQTCIKGDTIDEETALFVCALLSEVGILL